MLNEQVVHDVTVQPQRETETDSVAFIVCSRPGGVHSVPVG